jgi:acyl-CoA thioester hydrolase
MTSHVSESKFRVRYAETDQMGVVYYANYFVWMEIGRTDFCRDCGFVYRDLERDEKAFIAVADASCRYISPAKYDDEICVRTTIMEIRRKVIIFTYTISVVEKLIAEGRTVHVVLGEDGRPKALPEKYIELLKK